MLCSEAEWPLCSRYMTTGLSCEINRCCFMPPLCTISRLNRSYLISSVGDNEVELTMNHDAPEWVRTSHTVLISSICCICMDYWGGGGYLDVWFLGGVISDNWFFLGVWYLIFDFVGGLISEYLISDRVPPPSPPPPPPLLRPEENNFN